jgi:hypothetical protein
VPSVPLKSEYGPTLGALLAPRFRRASPSVRTLWIASVALFAAAVAAAALTLAPPSLSHGGPVPFSFSYRGLSRAAPPAGWYARVVLRARGGRLEDSFAVGPLLLPPHGGTLGAALALYAARHASSLLAPGGGGGPARGGAGWGAVSFALWGEGSTQVDTVSSYASYNLFCSFVLSGRRFFGRSVLLLPDRPSARRGVVVAMFGDVASNRAVASPLYVGVKGALEGPLGSFALE